MKKIRLSKSTIGDQEKQNVKKVLDEEFDVELTRMIEEEKKRLGVNHEPLFKPGDKIKVRGENLYGTVVKQEVWFDPKKDDEVLFGPNRYYSIATEEDQAIVTCDGVFRNVFVTLDPSPIHEDWGIDGEVKEFFEDEIEKVE